MSKLLGGNIDMGHSGINTKVNKQLRRNSGIDSSEVEEKIQNHLNQDLPDQTVHLYF